MLLEDYFETDTLPDCRLIRVKGTRVGIQFILDPYIAGDSAERIYHDYHHVLTLEQIHATITYYHREKAKLDAYLEECRAGSEARYQEYLKRGPSPAMMRIRALAERQKVAKEK